jgi:MbtH protein
VDEQPDRHNYRVVVNDEEQYSIWPAGRGLPLGWYEEGTLGPKPRCLERIREIWTDMRPKNLRERSHTGATTDSANREEARTTDER